MRQEFAEAPINVSALSEARFHKSVKSGRGALRAFDRALTLIRTCPSQAPQSAHREDDGEERGHAEQEIRQNPEEG